MISLRLWLFLVSIFLPLIANAGVSNWVDFELVGGHVKIPIEINGNSGYAILDSGSQINGINENFISKYQLDLARGRKISVKGVYGTEKRQTYLSITAQLFGQALSFRSLVGASLGHFENAILLGAPFFSDVILQIDYPNARLRIISKDTPNMNKYNNLEAIRQKGSGLLIVKIDVNNDKSLWTILDTGNSGGLMLERNAAHLWLGKYDLSTSTSYGANIMGYHESFRIPEMKFGPYVLENVLVSVPAEGQHANLTSRFTSVGTHIKGRKVEGILGFDILKHFVLTIDYGAGHAHVETPQ